MERWSRADPSRYPQRQLPCPDLTQPNPETGEYWLEEAGGQELVARYVSAREALTYGTPPGGRRGVAVTTSPPPSPERMHTFINVSMGRQDRVKAATALQPGGAVMPHDTEAPASYLP